MEYSHLDLLENKSIYIIREVYSQFKDIAVLWSMGKDSTTLLWLIKKAFYNEIPFPVLHIDTGFKFKEIYDFRDKWTKELNLDLRVIKNDMVTNKDFYIKTEVDKFICCQQLKTDALKQAIEKYKFKALLLGIRRDEHGIRNKERYVSPRNEQFIWNYENQPVELWDLYNTEIVESCDNSHLRIHPLLHWTELDIWKYIQKENIPIVDLYLAKNVGKQSNLSKRYRSIGCEPCCEPVDSNADTIEKIIEELESTDITERSGRCQDKEDNMMQKLRSLGYM